MLHETLARILSGMHAMGYESRRLEKVGMPNECPKWWANERVEDLSGLLYDASGSHLVRLQS